MHRTLVIMAGGLGSRFGGLKQVEPVDKFGNFIVDYSVFDGKNSNFTDVVFIIKKENKEVFKRTILKRVPKGIKGHLAYQDLNTFCKGAHIKNRTKPWGTAHAVLCAKKKIKGDFAVINADDFYGSDSFKVADTFFEEEKNRNILGLVGFEIQNTLSKTGEVNRGICEVENGFLKDVVESKVKWEKEKIVARGFFEKEFHEIGKTTPCSMNFMMLRKEILGDLEKNFYEFLKSPQTNLQTDEIFILNEVVKIMQKRNMKMRVLNTSSVWHGITYKEDKEDLVKALKKLVDNGEYDFTKR